MRELLLAGCLTILVSIGAQAQVSPGFLSSVVSPEQAVMVPSGFVDAAQSPLLRRAPTRPCCNLKGALIGLGVGAAAGIVLTMYTCDASDCTSSYFRSIAVLGGIGSGLGAFSARSSRFGPTSVPAFPRLSISPFVSKRTSGAVVAVRF
jgi:hypothetical protein